jgi:hypothetical protein
MTIGDDIHITSTRPFIIAVADPSFLRAVGVPERTIQCLEV